MLESHWRFLNYHQRHGDSYVLCLLCHSVGWHRNPSSLLGHIWRACRFWSCHHGLQASSPSYQRPPGRNLPPTGEPYQRTSYMPGKEWQPVPDGGEERSCTGTRGPRCYQRLLRPLSHGEGRQFREPGDGSHRDCLQTDGEQVNKHCPVKTHQQYTAYLKFAGDTFVTLMSILLITTMILWKFGKYAKYPWSLVMISFETSLSGWDETFYYPRSM